MTEQGRNELKVDNCPVCGTWIGFHVIENELTQLASSKHTLDAAGVTCDTCGCLVAPADKIPGVIPADPPLAIVPRTAYRLCPPPWIELPGAPTKRLDDGEIVG